MDAVIPNLLEASMESRNGFQRSIITGEHMGALSKSWPLHFGVSCIRGCVFRGWPKKGHNTLVTTYHVGPSCFPSSIQREHAKEDPCSPVIIPTL